MPAPDWDAIRADYMANGLSCREIAKKYGVSKSAAAKKIKEEWRAQAWTIRDNVRNTVDAELEANKTDAMLTMIRAADTMSEVLEALSVSAKRFLADDAVNIKQVESLVRAINLNAETISQLHGVPTQAQRHAQHLAEERLAIERERLEMEKRRAVQDDQEQTVRVVIDAPDGYGDLDG